MRAKSKSLLIGEVPARLRELLEQGGVEVVSIGDWSSLENAASFAILVTASHVGVTQQQLALLPHLRILARAAAGLENIDLAAAQARGIAVVSAPEANAQSAAELTMALLFAVARRLTHHDPALRNGRWSRNEALGFELSGKRIGIVGLGRVGSRVATMARAIPMAPMAYDPFIGTERFALFGVARALTLEKLADQSDVLTFHCPLTELTRGMGSAKLLSRLPKGAVVLNCARGGILDEGVLLELLENGHLAGLGLDCWEQEPPPANHPLFRLTGGRVVGMPHAGARTEQARRRAADETAANIFALLGD